MRSSDLEKQAAATLATALERLEEDHIHRTIDEPLEQAVRGFARPPDTSFSYRHFLDVLAVFVQHMYAHGLRLPRELSPDQALAEAIHLLRFGYPDAHGDGYDAALVDAANPTHDGMGVVLDALAAAFTTRERQEYEYWAWATTVGSAAWPVRVHIAAILLSDRHVRQALPKATPIEYADDLYVLVRQRLELAHAERQLLGIQGRLLLT
jgi:hypothetical protein